MITRVIVSIENEENKVIMIITTRKIFYIYIFIHNIMHICKYIYLTGKHLEHHMENLENYFASSDPCHGISKHSELSNLAVDAIAYDILSGICTSRIF